MFFVVFIKFKWKSVFFTIDNNIETIVWFLKNQKVRDWICVYIKKKNVFMCVIFGGHTLNVWKKAKNLQHKAIHSMVSQKESKVKQNTKWTFRERDRKKRSKNNFKTIFFFVPCVSLCACVCFDIDHISKRARAHAHHHSCIFSLIKVICLMMVFSLNKNEKYFR